MSRAALRRLGALFFLALAGASHAAELRLMDYNILNYPGSTGSARAPHFRTVVAAVEPDLIVVQEIAASTGVSRFIAEVLEPLEPGLWAAAPYHDGYDSDRALFVRGGCVTVSDYGWLDTDLRDIEWWDLRVASSGEEFRLYTLHLKASSGSTNEARRYQECLVLRDDLDLLPTALPVLVAGDYNLYTASEPAWQLLRSPGPGQLLDPIQTEGAWHNNAAFAAVHTQSPRTDSFGGGATGGMDDRFDFVLADDDWFDGAGLELIEGSYTALGNDGAHFNTSILDGPNGVVSFEVANALHEASDHLPLFVDLAISDLVAAGAAPAPPGLAAFPNPFNPATRLRLSLPAAGRATLDVYDPRGRRVARLLDAERPAGELVLDWRPEALSAGLYLAVLELNGHGLAQSKLLLLK